MPINNAIIVPRWGGSPHTDWYKWLDSNISQLKVQALDMPTPEAPVIDEWVDEIAYSLEKLKINPKSCLLIGHSVGCQAIVRYLASDRCKSEFPSCILVAAWFDVDKPWPTLMPWINTPIDFEKANSRTAATQVLLSDNDPFTSDYKNNRHNWQKQMAAEVTLISGAKHFNNSEEPEVLKLVQKVLKNE